MKKSALVWTELRGPYKVSIQKVGGNPQYKRHFILLYLLYFYVALKFDLWPIVIIVDTYRDLYLTISKLDQVGLQFGQTFTYMYRNTTVSMEQWMFFEAYVG